MTIEELYKIIQDRKKNLPKDSYVASLFKKGRDRIIQKVGEESVEVVIAAKNEDKQRLVSETADLWFHLLILMVETVVTPEEILGELGKRHQK